jgi:NAD-dependent DNA ligase
VINKNRQFPGLRATRFTPGCTLARFQRAKEEAQARIEALGGKAATGVSKNLSVLVATSNTSTKWKKAEELNAKGANIQLWTEEMFLEMLNKAKTQTDH